jgi:hypothetical protein
VVDLIEEAVRLQAFLDGHASRFCFIGGVAVQNWGEPRLTRDIDVSLLTGFGGEERWVDLTFRSQRCLTRNVQSNAHTWWRSFPANGFGSALPRICSS